jgi:hypothetical protein
MESDWAAQHLQTIRTLMERAAVYRRALGPIMIFIGAVGLMASFLGGRFTPDTPQAFVKFWLVVSLVPLAGAYLLVRRQALKDAEPFWSPPTRRVTQALLPPLSAGLVVSVELLRQLDGLEPQLARTIGMLWLPLAWVVWYGCALHAAGFFMPRGIKLFGWIFIASGCCLFAVGLPDRLSARVYAHSIMGFFFGVMHLAYGVYLSSTEKQKRVA